MRSLFLVLVLVAAGVLAFVLVRAKTATPDGASVATPPVTADARESTELQQLSAPTANPSIASNADPSRRTPAATPAATPTPTVEPKNSSASPSASTSIATRATDAVDPKTVGLDDEELDSYFATKYAGWSSERMTEALLQVEATCKAIEGTPELLKTQHQEYRTLQRELGWLKEHRQE